MTLANKFLVVCEEVGNFSKKPSENDLLELYALYKQATMGNVSLEAPSDSVLKLKWISWSSKTGMAKDDAMKNYIDLAEKLSVLYK